MSHRIRNMQRSLRRQARAALGLRALAADRRSRWLLSYLIARTAFPWPPPREPVSVRVRIGPRVFPVQLQTRTDLSLLHEIELLREYGPADDVEAEVIVDLGAHIGLATLHLLATHPKARIVAVEADPALVSRLRGNVAGLPVTVVHAAICGQSGVRAFYRSDHSTLANSLQRTLPDQVPVEIPTLSLEDLLDAQGVRRLDLLKLDIEGAEWDLFLDGVPAGIQAIVGEIHTQAAHTPDEFIERLSSASLNVRQLSSENGRVTFIATREEVAGA